MSKHDDCQADRVATALEVLRFKTLAESKQGAELREAALKLLTKFLKGEKV